jgi:hypothetical protein
VKGISPIMGYFSLTHDGATTILICAYASAEEVKVAFKNLLSIGLLTVTKDIFGLCLGMDGQNIYPETVSLFSIWSTTFADDSKDGCEPGSCDKCQENIGDLPPLMIDPSLLTYNIGVTQQQSAPIIEIFEVVKGSSGNMIDNA